MAYYTYNYSIHGFINQLITGGHHIVGNQQQRKMVRLGFKQHRLVISQRKIGSFSKTLEH